LGKTLETVLQNSNILINAMLFGPGGGSTHLSHLCSALVKRGAKVTLVTRYAHPDNPVVRNHRELSIRLVTTPFARNRRLYRLSTAWALLAWPRLLGRGKYDLLYTWELSAFTRFLSRFVRPAGRVLWQRIGEPFAPDGSVDPALEKLLDGLLVESPIHAEAAAKVISPEVPILTLPMLSHGTFAPARNGHRPGDVFSVAFLGRYDSAKGIYRLLDIWPELNIGEAELNFHAWGPERDTLSRLVSERGLGKRVHVNGAYSTPEELSAILKKTDLVVLPSETEGVPLVLVEAIAHGVPFVASDVGAVRTLADDNPDVRVVPLDNLKLKEAIESTVSMIRSGQIRSDRLQAYYQARYGYEALCGRWTEMFLNGESLQNRER
jgi:glycosyltransferase involved in cell wall biosynthesis